MTVGPYSFSNAPTVTDRRYSLEYLTSSPQALARLETVILAILAELPDATDSKSVSREGCGFDPRRRHIFPSQVRGRVFSLGATQANKLL